MTKKGTHSYIEDSRNGFILIYIDGQIVARIELLYVFLTVVFYLVIVSGQIIGSKI